VTADRGWKRPFDDPIPLPRGRQLVTLEDAAAGGTARVVNVQSRPREPSFFHGPRPGKGERCDSHAGRNEEFREVFVVPPTAPSRLRSPREGLMANKSRGTWYVSFELRRRKRAHTRATETFRSELEAKKFARAKLAETQNVSAGTLNPHLPKRTIPATQMLEWLEEPDEADLA
jgi:hypothetical protein